MFAIGFVLGALRTIIFAPRIGQSNAILIELPVMLAVSWWATGWALGRWQLSTVSGCCVMGAVGFALLMVAELSLAIIAFGETPARWAADLIRTPGAYGFASQIAFGLMPFMRARRNT